MTQAIDLITPVWYNTYWVKNAIDLYDGISQHAKELNNSHAHFCGLIQNFSRDAMVIGICKLYDTSNKRFKKYTVPDLYHHLKRNFSKVHIANVPEKLLNKVRTSHKSRNILEDIQASIPNVNNDNSLEWIFKNRDKVTAHQEQLDPEMKEILKHLPSLEEMNRLNEYAADFCYFMADVFSNVTLLPPAISARMAALNASAKLLGKNFSDPLKTPEENHREYELFYRRQH